MRFLLVLLTLLHAALAEVYPDNIYAKDKVPNCGTVETSFKMGQLLYNTTNCHQTRWPAVYASVDEGCTCAFFMWVLKR